MFGISWMLKGIGAGFTQLILRNRDMEPTGNGQVPTGLPVLQKAGLLETREKENKK